MEEFNKKQIEQEINSLAKEIIILVEDKAPSDGHALHAMCIALALIMQANGSITLEDVNSTINNIIPQIEKIRDGKK